MKLLLAILIMLPLSSQALILLENKSGRYSTRTKIPNFDQAQRMKRQRRIGLGLSAAGVHGLLGGNLELNLKPELSLMGGFGLSNSFYSFNTQIKRSLYGNDITPYMALGYAHWSNSSDDPVEDTIPSFLGKKFLSDNEISSGEFSENLLYVSLGLQFYQLTGEWIGLSLYAELIGVMDIDDTQVAPTFSLGSTYYF